MKLICQGNELSDALAKVVKALPVKRNNPILDGVKLTALGDTLTIFATDLELAIEKKINAQVLIEGEIVVPGKLFADYAKKIEEEQVELDGTDPTKLIIKYLDSELMIKCFSADEYPVFKEVDTQNSFIILKKELKDIISKVIFNVAVDEARPSLRGVCLNVKDEEVEAVASDGYRLALAKAQINNNGVIDKIVVPSKSMNELARQMTIFPPNACWTINKYWQEGNLLMGECTTLAGGYGDMVRDRILTNYPAMASSRAIGGTDKSGNVLPGYTAITFDCVIRPSHKVAYQVKGSETINEFPIVTPSKNTMSESAVLINPENSDALKQFLLDESASRTQIYTVCEALGLDADTMTITENAVKISRINEDGSLQQVVMPLQKLVNASYYHLFK